MFKANFREAGAGAAGGPGKGILSINSRVQPGPGGGTEIHPDRPHPLQDQGDNLGWSD